MESGLLKLLDVKKRQRFTGAKSVKAKKLDPDTKSMIAGAGLAIAATIPIRAYTMKSGKDINNNETSEQKKQKQHQKKIKNIKEFDAMTVKDKQDGKTYFLMRNQKTGKVKKTLLEGGNK